MNKTAKRNAEILVMLAFLTALSVVMSRFLSINSTFFKLDTSFKRGYFSNFGSVPSLKKKKKATKTGF